MSGEVEVVSCDVAVVGAGLAGLAAALASAPLAVSLLTKTPFAGGGASVWAQGGIAAAVGEGDTPALHAADTLSVGGGLAIRGVVDLLTREAPRRIEWLSRLGARFDRDPGGSLCLGREAAHSRSRILHAGGDATGAELVRALAAGVRRRRHLTVFERTRALELVLAAGRVVGVAALHPGGRPVLHLARAVVLATGGIGRAFLHTTNPPEATGDGLAMAARAGALLADLEFVQFHPTALAVGADPMPLLSEALRGEGALLVDARGRRFLADEHPAAELAPRDVVARAIYRRLARGERVFLDARRALGDRLPARFPTVFAHCRRHGLDPRVEPIPVAPAAHYHMGGIAVDERGRTSLPGLWACGEVASTGAHGANRLASNSLLEALVFGARVAEDLAACLPPAVAAPRSGRPAPARAAAVPAEAARVEAAVRRVLWEDVGVVRDEAALASALRRLEELAAAPRDPGGEVGSLLTVGRLIAAAALARRESRGSHFRSDHPTPDPGWERRLTWTFSPAGEPQPAGRALAAAAAQSGPLAVRAAAGGA
jgi:L-aspartate oxidase